MSFSQVSEYPPGVGHEISPHSSSPNLPYCPPHTPTHQTPFSIFLFLPPTPQKLVNFVSNCSRTPTIFKNVGGHIVWFPDWHAGRVGSGRGTWLGAIGLPRLQVIHKRKLIANIFWGIFLIDFCLCHQQHMAHLFLIITTLHKWKYIYRNIR